MAKRKRKSTVDSTTLDRFGRVVIPREVRARLGLEPGDALRIEVGEDSVTLHPAKGTGEWVVRDGLPVWTGPVPVEAPDIVAFIRRQREERIREIWERTLRR
jgi:AbrB family looped-hinge helix DNA binding protein